MKSLLGAVSITTANQDTLMPHSEGTTWTYTLDIQRQIPGTAPAASPPTDVVYKIDAAKKRGDETSFLLGIYREGKKSDEQMWSVGPKGIFQVSLGSARRPFDPPQPVVAFPVKVGEDFKWKGTTQAANGRRVASQLVGSVIGTQTVDIADGSADAMLFESVSNFDITAPNGQKAQAQTVTDSWFRPGVGIVRYRQTTRAGESVIVYTLRLKSYKIG